MTRNEAIDKLASLLESVALGMQPLKNRYGEASSEETHGKLKAELAEIVDGLLSPSEDAGGFKLGESSLGGEDKLAG